MKTFSLILGLLLLSAQASHAARYCKTERVRSFAEQVATLDPSADLDLFDLELFPKGTLAGGYEYEVEPAYSKGLYLRKDRWQVNTSAVPSDSHDFSNGMNVIFSGGLKGSVEASFIRFFDDPCMAMLANPYAPNRMPLRSSIALGPKFAIGDYFLLRGSLGFVVSADILSLLSASSWGLGLSGSYLMDGYYQFHLVRLDDTHVRLKIVAQRAKTLAASLGIGWDGQFEVFKVDQLNNRLEKFVNTKPLKISYTDKDSSVFLVDYILDLSDPEVSTAFENVIRKVNDFKNISLVGPFRKQNDIDRSVLLDLAPLEDLYLSDLRSNNVGRLRRNLRTNSEQQSHRFAVTAGNKIFGLKFDGGRAKAQMNVKDEQDVLERYLLRSWDKKWEGRFLYSWYRRKEEESFRALFKAGNDYKEITPVNLVKHISRQQNRFSFRNFKEMQITLKKGLPLEVFKDIPFQNWPQKPGEKFFNYGLRFELLMAPESITDAPFLSPEEIEILFRDNIKSKGLSADDYFNDLKTAHQTRTAEDQFDDSLKYMAKILSMTLDNRVPLAERVGNLTKLRMNRLFQQSGIGFLMSLRPEHMKSHYHLDLDISSNEAMIDYSWGDHQLSVLYKKILTIKAALDDDGLDLLREAESISLPKSPHSHSARLR